MKLPKWAPSKLVETYKELKPNADAEQKHIEKLVASKQPSISWKTYLLREEAPYIGPNFVGHLHQIKIATRLLTKPVMESVWKNLERRNGSFKPVLSLYGGKEQARNLFAACVEAETRWINLPKRTKAESKRLYDDIAAMSLQLCELLIDVRGSSNFLDTRRYITQEKLKEFIDSLERDGHDIWSGFDDYLDHLLGELIPALPRILLLLNQRALEAAKNPHSVRQPRSPSAKLNFFIDELSSYFKKAYGTPLHSHVAAVVSALFDEDVAEDRVRALLRSRKSASKARSRRRSPGKEFCASGQFPAISTIRVWF